LPSFARTIVGSHDRIGIFRVFGRDAGFTALYTAYAISIRCVIPEYKVTAVRIALGLKPYGRLTGQDDSALRGVIEDLLRSAPAKSERSTGRRKAG